MNPWNDDIASVVASMERDSRILRTRWERLLWYTLLTLLAFDIIIGALALAVWLVGWLP